MHDLPQAYHLPIDRLQGVFRNVTNSYKYYWFLAIIELLEKKGDPKMAFDDLALQMLADVWYPLRYFKLSFGLQDGFKPISENIQTGLTIQKDDGKFSDIHAIIRNKPKSERQKLSSKTRSLLRWVPYRFQRPFVRDETSGLKESLVNLAIEKAAEQHFQRGSTQVMYRYPGDGYIEINPVWVEYLRQHANLLRGFIYWELTRFLQQRNPNVPGISEKLFRPEKRKLTKASERWKEYLKAHTDTRCIYSGKILTPEMLSIDHFIPWSFVTHDELWNLAPTLPSVNSSKSDQLPALPVYLRNFSQLQQHFFLFHYRTEKRKPLETYSLLFNESLDSIASYSEEAFHSRLSEQIQPLYQTARNMGFSSRKRFGKD